MGQSARAKRVGTRQQDDRRRFTKMKIIQTLGRLGGARGANRCVVWVSRVVLSVTTTTPQWREGCILPRRRPTGARECRQTHVHHMLWPGYWSTRGAGRTRHHQREASLPPIQRFTFIDKILLSVSGTRPSTASSTHTHTLSEPPVTCWWGTRTSLLIAPSYPDRII